MQPKKSNQVMDQEAVPVRATLTCGWCGREIYGVEGRMDATRGRLHLASASALFTLSAGWPRCLHCGGPLFLDSWKPERRRGRTEASTEALESERLAVA